MPVSHRHTRAAAKLKAAGPVSTKYVIIDEAHQGPDLGGIAVVLDNGRKCVSLLPVQAQYWLDQGVIEPYEAEPEPSPEPGQEQKVKAPKPAPKRYSARG